MYKYFIPGWVENVSTIDIILQWENDNVEIVFVYSGISGLATETEMNIKELQELIAEDSRKTEEFEVL